MPLAGAAPRIAAKRKRGQHPVPDELYQAEPLRAREAEGVYPLVSLMHPEMTLEAWRQFVRRSTRVPRSCGGLVAIRDRRGYVHAVFAYRFGETLQSGRALRITDIVMGRLPGGTLPRALIACAERLADELGSPCVTLDVLEDAVGAADRESLREAGFTPSGLVMTRRLDRHPEAAVLVH
jgi:hypothetical protein